MQTSNPFWLKEAYSKEIGSYDTGLVRRNLVIALEIDLLLRRLEIEGPFLDWAGGTGLLVRLMRDMGYDFYFYDLYQSNIFAPQFSVDTMTDRPKLITMIEVMEHLIDPVSVLKEICSHSPDYIVMTQELIPPSLRDDWWYLVPFSGQHISFYSSESFIQLAKKFNLEYFTFGNLHLFVRKSCKVPKYTFTSKAKNLLMRLIPNSLIKGNGHELDFKRMTQIQIED